MDQADAIAPTPEFLRRHEVDAPKKSQKKDRTAYRVRRVVGDMFRDGYICERAVAAAERFYRDAVRGMSTPGLVGAYGERAGGQTPISQIAHEVACPAERRTFHHASALEAMSAINQPEQLAMVMKCVALEMTLAEAAKQVFGGSRDMASGMGKYALKLGLQALVEHYDGKYAR
jgi:hypothetical protein